MFKSTSCFFQNLTAEKTNLFISPDLDDLYKADDQMLAQGKYDAIVDKCIAKAEHLNQRELLKQLAFVLFSGARVNCNVINSDLLRKQWAFILLMNDENTILNESITVLRNCYQSWKAIKCNHQFEKAIIQPSLSLLSPIAGIIDSEDEILITHGGGYFYIQAFLNGKVAGYPLEGNCGLGLQVHVSHHEKTLHYSNTKAWLHMDEPAFLIARIKAKYLCIQNRNSYEAGLRKEWFSQIQDAKVIRMPHGWLGNGLDALITERPFSHLPNLQAHINVLQQQFNTQRENHFNKQLDLWNEHYTKNYANKVDKQMRYIFNKESNCQQSF